MEISSTGPVGSTPPASAPAVVTHVHMAEGGRGGGQGGGSKKKNRGGGRSGRSGSGPFCFFCKKHRHIVDKCPNAKKAKELLGTSSVGNT